MPPKQYRTSTQDFEVFKASCQQWIQYFGLKSWELAFAHSDRHIENRATCEASLGSRHVTFTLTKSKWAYQPDERELRLLGFHEVCECLLWELTHFAEARYPQGDLQDITHAVIHALENSIFHQLDSVQQTLNNDVLLKRE